MSDPLVTKRIQNTQNLINTEPELQKIIKDNTSYWDKVKTYDVIRLVKEIQPRWNNRNSLSDKESAKLALLMLAYRLQGLDVEYFTSGAGASYGDGDSNCVIV